MTKFYLYDKETDEFVYSTTDRSLAEYEEQNNGVYYVEKEIST